MCLCASVGTQFAVYLRDAGVIWYEKSGPQEVRSLAVPVYGEASHGGTGGCKSPNLGVSLPFLSSCLLILAVLGTHCPVSAHGLYPFNAFNAFIMSFRDDRLGSSASCTLIAS